MWICALWCGLFWFCYGQHVQTIHHHMESFWAFMSIVRMVWYMCMVVVNLNPNVCAWMWFLHLSFYHHKMHHHHCYHPSYRHHHHTTPQAGTRCRRIIHRWCEASFARKSAPPSRQKQPQLLLMHVHVHVIRQQHTRLSSEVKRSDLTYWRNVSNSLNTMKQPGAISKISTVLECSMQTKVNGNKSD